MSLTPSFHWGSPVNQAGLVPARFVDACGRAAAAGFESVEITVAEHIADAFAKVAAAAAALPDLRLRLTCPSLASLSVDAVTEQLTNLCNVLRGRLILHLKINEDAEALDASLTGAGVVAASVGRLCSRLENLEIDVEGQTAETAFFAIRYADRLWRQPHRPTMVDGDASPVLHFGTQVGLVAGLIARETRSEALAAAADCLADADLVGDSASWSAPSVWAGGGWGPGELGGEAAGEGRVVLIGSFDEVARTIHRYARGGISSLLVRGCGVQAIDEREMAFFSDGVLPLVRRLD